MLRNQKRRIVSKLWICLCFENNIKTLKLQKLKDEEQIENSFQYLLKIPKIGLSCIGSYKEHRSEIMHIMLEGIEVEMTGNADITDLNLFISKCRIEN